MKSEEDVPSGRLNKIFERHCDKKKAAERWKKSYALAATAWTVRLGVIFMGAADLYQDYTSVAHTNKSFIQNIQQNPNLVIKFAAYQTAWLGLTIVRWGGFFYGSFGLYHDRKFKNKTYNPDIKSP
jgi:hypothetical protein